ncbi:reverse transcriptase domain-containing protein [Tanacetum coccineum]
MNTRAKQEEKAPCSKDSDSMRTKHISHSVKASGSSRYKENHSEAKIAAAITERWAIANMVSHVLFTLPENAGFVVDDLSPDQSDGDEGAEGPLIIEAEIGGHQVHSICVDGGSSFEILYEHCFNRLRPEIKNQMVPATTSLIGFNGEIKWPLRQITLLVKIRDDEHSTSAWMDFMVVRSTSPHNGIIGRPGLRKIQAVPSTAHGMIKFPVMGGILTLKDSKIIPVECAMVSGPEEQPILVNKVKEERVKVAINPEHPEQTVMIGSDLAEKTRMEHRLNVRKGCQPVRQKKRGQAAERNVAINDEVSKLVTAGIMREVHYHDWLSNPVMVKKSDNSWRMCVDFKDLNKACPKDGYPLPEIDWKVESLCGFPFKCFLDAYKGYHQIQMAEEDEEKTAFITNQGIFCYTKMPFGLRNAGATYQRLVDKTFHGQIGRNLEGHTKALDMLTKGRRRIKPSVTKMLERRAKIKWKIGKLKQDLSKISREIIAIFQNSKKIQKKSDFLWTEDAEAAFRQMKEHTAKLPMLIAPEEQEESRYWQIQEATRGRRSGRFRKGRRTAPGTVDIVHGWVIVHGYGAGVILTDPEGVEFTYALRF